MPMAEKPPKIKKNPPEEKVDEEGLTPEEREELKRIQAELEKRAKELEELAK